MKKKCRKCVEVKPLEEFYKDKSKKDKAERKAKKKEEKESEILVTDDNV